MINASQQTAARVAGVAYILSFVLVVSVNFGINERLFVSGNPAATAQNILANETLFRAGIVGDLFYCLFVVVLSAALYIVLEPVSRGIALLAALCRLVWSMIWILKTLSYFAALSLLHAKGLEVQTAQSLARLSLHSGFDQYYVGLLFAGLAPTLCAYLFWKSRYIPRWFAAFGMVASAWSVLCTVIFMIIPDFGRLINPWLFDTALALFELSLSFLLLFRRLRA